MLRAGLIVSLAVAALVGSIHFFDERPHPVADTSFVMQLPVPAELLDGDIVFRTGRDVMARLVLSQGESPRFSHVGVLVRDGADVSVVHALPGEGALDGVRIESLSVFASHENAADIGFYRVKGMDSVSRRKVRDYALQQIGKPFDHAFSFNDDGRFYCTELVLKSLAAANVAMTQNLPSVAVFMLNEPVFPPDILRRSQRLEIMVHTEEPSRAMALRHPQPHADLRVALQADQQ